PGTVIQLEPGVYRFSGRNIAITRGGEQQAPIILRSPVLGEAQLEFSLLEGFHVKAPYWVFENLLITGTCDEDSACEHAFHVVEKGRSFVLRNSIIRDFNAAIKVNGVNNHYPDYGLVEHSSFYNTRPRETANPVSLLNINSSDRWLIRGNLLADFFKTKGDRVSYAAYMKGNGSQGIFEQNLVVCELNLHPDSTTQVGLSFGGGGTAKQYCRDQKCLTEHTVGIMRNNIILNCSNDVGIYLNRSAQTQIYNNAILNSLGIDVRFDTSTATIVNNIVAGRIQDRDGGYSFRENNLVDLDCMKPGFPIPFNCSFENWFRSPYQADLAIKNGQSLLGRGIEVEDLTEDFCGNKRIPPKIDIGPIQY
ncbi:MAG: PE-PGRS family protein, partial [Anaerolineae bacterium]|nr:PE-PGRS family protein [Anaerolineae bacterium]